VYGNADLGQHGHVLAVVVDDADLVGAAVSPAEKDAPLVVDADRVIAGEVALERLESVARRDSQILESLGGLESDQFAHGGADEVGGKAAGTGGPSSTGEVFGGAVTEAPDHVMSVTVPVTQIKDGVDWLYSR
jgi:hypothetical protein